MEHEGEHKVRRRTRYRDPMAGLVVLTLLALVMLSVIAVQLRLITVEVRLGPRLRATAARVTSVSTAAAESRVVPVKAPKVVKPVIPVAAPPDRSPRSRSRHLTGRPPSAVIAPLWTFDRRPGSRS